ncbi:MAG: ribulose-phosphate 3-epimerase [Anaerolineae bacterium]|nr:ribulose-phosphate 3-epimerase [Anaerolineae bacterium]
MKQVKLVPSILSADFTRLGEQIQEAEAGGGDWIHVDIMDGHFVPNLTFGPLIVSAVRSVTNLTIDVHLMMETPDRYLAAFAEAGADRMTVHVETCPHLHRTVQLIQELGCQPGVTLNPATPLSTLVEILPQVDLVLIMSVNPGYGGQVYIPGSTGKIARLRQMLDDIGSPAEIEVDGGVNSETVPEIVGAGATVLVAGSAIFNNQASVAENIRQLRSLIPR